MSGKRERKMPSVRILAARKPPVREVGRAAPAAGSSAAARGAEETGAFLDVDVEAFGD